MIRIASLVFISLLLFNVTNLAQGTLDKKHIEVSLRMIGHQVLLNAGDSASRVLPIIKDRNQYKIQFESEFAFNPDELVNTVNQVIKDTRIATGYIMEVEQSQTGDIVYSYEIGDVEGTDIIPCKSRAQPKSSYNLLFTLSDSLPTLIHPDSSARSQSKTSKIPTIAIVLPVSLTFVILFIFWRRNSRSSIDPKMIKLGNYYFDQRNAVLIMQEQRTELTSKEADLLSLLYQTANETVERDVILNKVWGDEGDYIGRTMDVFISKLRKKLEADPTVKIVNIRGVGYKLVINE